MIKLFSWQCPVCKKQTIEITPTEMRCQKIVYFKSHFRHYENSLYVETFRYDNLLVENIATGAWRHVSSNYCRVIIYDKSGQDRTINLDKYCYNGNIEELEKVLVLL